MVVSKRLVSNYFKISTVLKVNGVVLGLAKDFVSNPPHVAFESF